MTGTLSAVTNALGQAIFDTLTEKVVGTFTLTAAKGTINTQSNQFSITAGAAATMAFVQQPLSTFAGTTLNPVIVQVKDKFGNLVSGSSVGLALSPRTLTSGTTPVPAASGLAVFSDLVEDTIGTYSLVASTSGLPSISSIKFKISAVAAVALTFLTPSKSTTAGAILSPFIVAVADQFGNVVPQAGRVIMITENGLTTRPYITNAQGKATISNWTNTFASTSHMLTALSSGLTPATSNTYTIAPGTEVIHFLSAPQSVQVGFNFGPVTVLVTDAYGNLLNNPVVVNVRLSSGTISAGSSTTSRTTDSGGEATFGSLFENLAGKYSLIAWATGIAGVTSSSFTITA